jgi:hypothetical protein
MGDTLSDFVIAKLGHPWVSGETVRIESFVFTVLKAKPPRGQYRIGAVGLLKFAIQIGGLSAPSRAARAISL